MYEVISRRYKRVKEEKQEQQPMPSLVLVDGGSDSCTPLPALSRNLDWPPNRWLPSPSARR